MEMVWEMHTGTSGLPVQCRLLAVQRPGLVLRAVHHSQVFRDAPMKAHC